MTQLANRTRELTFFRRMLEGKASERILLIEAPSGFGKTNLLLRFERDTPDDYCIAWVDLKSAQTGLSYVFERIRRKVGAESFPRFDAAVQQFLVGGVQINDNQIQGRDNQIQLVLAVQDEEQRNLRLSILIRAFFQDLHAVDQSILIILDTFNQATEILAQQIEGSFLSEVADIPGLLVVLAGQSLPKPTGEWLRCAKQYKLDAIRDPDAWYKYAKDVGLPLNRDNIEPLVKYLQGKPASIVQALEMVSN